MKGVVKGQKKSFFLTEDRATIELYDGIEKQEYYFKKKVWSYTVKDKNGRVLLYSKLSTDSRIKQFFGIAPIVFYNSENCEIVRVNDHLSFKSHSIILDGNFRTDFLNKGYKVEFGQNMVYLNEERNQIEFECEDKYIIHSIAISISMWNKFNQGT